MQQLAQIPDMPQVDVIVYFEDGENLYAVQGGPDGYDPDALNQFEGAGSWMDHEFGAFGALGGFWGSIGGFFKKIGRGIVAVVKKAKDNPAVQEGIAAWLQQQGGAAAVAQNACIFDQSCRAYFKLTPSGPGTQTFVRAQQGECVGKKIYQASSVSGWVSPCMGFGGGGLFPSTLGAGWNPAGLGPLSSVGDWFRFNWQWVALLGAVGLGGIVLLKSVGGRRRRRLR